MEECTIDVIQQNKKSASFSVQSKRQTKKRPSGNAALKSRDFRFSVIASSTVRFWHRCEPPIDANALWFCDSLHDGSGNGPENCSFRAFCDKIVLSPSLPRPILKATSHYLDNSFIDSIVARVSGKRNE